MFKLYLWYLMWRLAILARLGKLVRPARLHLEIDLVQRMNYLPEEMATWHFVIHYAVT